MEDYLILAVAAFFAGTLNTVAGGGTFLTFPALVYAGIPIVSANATSAVAVFPGYLGGALGFRSEIAAFDRRRLVHIAALTALGGLVGSLLLLVSSNKAFSLVVPFLLAIATVTFAFGTKIQSIARRFGSGTGKGWFSTLLISIYGGYFNGGLGIVLLALFSLWGMRDLNTMNGLKSGLSFILSAISVITFAVAGIVAWPQALVMMVASTIGGYAGAPLARALPASVVRLVVIVVGTVMSLIFFSR
ncbi:sulfite exporter TauE/SafE family protein [Nitratireductor kimnyeongensis]|uniref:Probable membrane transporter protein n=1 Tax=Nitratireductor kimnyeongensis TaxID=430679 RepID=A0ABW0T707_9HYPH|nr:sulfite exporter TauE/SafE family protein [Nitratireductor kimnyeongensis]QZZ34435.1 sulfite exporter TauE/SafE family protein [Nitratireductor kimnyeongensis]